MSPWDMAVLRDVVRPEDPEKALFVVRSLPGNERKGIACSVKTESGKVFLVTCKDVANPENIGRNDGRRLVADRLKHNRKHNRSKEIQDIRNDNKFSFIPLLQSSNSTFQLYRNGNGTFTRQCYSLAVIDNKTSKRIDWSYNEVNQRHVLQTDHDLGNNAIILGSPVLWNDGIKRFVVGVVGSDSDFPLLPIFFETNSHKIPDLPKAVTLNKLRDEESRDKIPLSWSRVDRASTYRVYKRIKNEDGEWNDWERVRTTADDSYEIIVERKKTYQFKVIGVNKNGDEGEGEIRTVKVLDVPMPVGIINLASEIKENNLTLRWNQPCDNGAQITHYTVYRRVLSENGAAPEWTEGSILALVPANQQLEYEDTRMETGKTYEFVVTATNTCGESEKVQESIQRVKVSTDELPDIDNLLNFLSYAWQLVRDWWNGNRSSL